MINNVKRWNGDNSFQRRVLWLALVTSPFVGSTFASENFIGKELFVQQSIKISGRVLDANSRQPLPNVTITVNGKSTSTTNATGVFTIDIPAGADVRFNLIGYESFSQKFNQSLSNKEILLSEASNDLDEVVVTALGIEREAKGLGYAVTTIKSDELNNAASSNWSDGLKGKVAGLNLTQASSGPVNSTRINLRGDRSLSGNNEALVVIDGIPMVNGKLSSGVNDAYGIGGSDVPIDFGNGLSDLNPEDIESVTVLKGAAATALYGSRAGNGALIITTKSGKNRKGLGISFSSNSSINDVLRWPDYQYEYGQGTNQRNAAGELFYSFGQSEDGPNTGSTSSAFGPKFNGQSYFQYDPATGTQSTERLPWVPYEDNIKGFWQTGSTLMNTLAIEGGTDKYSGRFSLGHTKNKWIMPNTGFERLVAAVNNKFSVTDKLSISSRVSYTNKSSDNLPATGYNNQSIAYFMIFQNPNIDLDIYKPMWQPGKEQIEQIHPFSSFIDNPYIIAYEMTNGLKNHNIEGNVQLNYNFSDKWDFMLRTGLNYRQDFRDMKRPWGTAQYTQGYYKEQDANWLEHNTDFLVNYREQLTDKIKMTVGAGGNIRKEESNSKSTSATGLMLPGIFKLSNALNNLYVQPTKYERQVNGLYALANFSFDDMIFLDLTARNDWSSTLPKGNNSYFYPSVTSSFILSDIFKLPSQVSFSKLRVSFAQVGSDTEPYRLKKVYSQNIFPGSVTPPSTQNNNDLKPEISNSFETGLNFSLFSNRLTADVNYYYNTTVNQVLRVPVDITTGYSYSFINGGKIKNEGIELMLSGKPFRGNFKWTPTVTWSKNYNEILELSKDLELTQQTIMSSGSASIIAVKGGTTGDIWGAGLVRNEEGQVVFNASTGHALRSPVKYIGNAYPSWRGGFQNEFNYKNLTLNVLVDGQYGGIIYSQTHHKMTEQGKLRHTLKGRDEGVIIGEGVVQNADGSYSPNTKEVAVQSYYSDYYRRANVETNSLDASYLKLREVRFQYAFPNTFVSKLKMSQLSLALYGRDLFMISKFPIFDPETASLNGADIMPGVEMGQLPTMRTFGFSLNVTL
ncbi:SusC/RagA family TonB-linked outer membrane protein [Sphingobacterium composti Ten et al. 2007 non Yoo et al. 2007]|uniref:SusC/RagA family TonB-linked outer membrane protein n=1 Tax=Sphingobacterium composti TaxID=363260 RepID=UPI001357D7C4|nr:SusC/RagA family TonB-linked outer membrane protein [Sphingobacterium composti Ten et al. 2007 non Yoo et al. 2007]